MTNPTEVVLVEMDQGRGILGVVDGFSSKGIEDENDIKWRKDFLQQIGYAVKGKRYLCARCRKRSPKPVKTPAPWYCALLEVGIVR